jgi:hypothetical protein
MTKKYEIHNQVTGFLEEAQTYEGALVLQQRIKEDYLKFNESLFTITVLVQNEDGSWTQSVSDANGNPIIIESVIPAIKPISSGTQEL